MHEKVYSYVYLHVPLVAANALILLIPSTLSGPIQSTHIEN